MIYINVSDNIKLHNTAVSIGNFDGLHKGHEILINAIKDYAEELKLQTVVFSFYPHPREVITGKPVYNILASEEKRRLLAGQGVDYFIEYPFGVDFMNLTPRDFFIKIVVEKLGCKVLVVGEGYRFGVNQSGDIGVLQNLCKEYKIKLVVVPHLMVENEKISSSAIRKLIMQNDFKTAEKFLTRPYFIVGKIIREIKSDSELKIICKPYEKKILPHNGVYITKTKLESKLYQSVTEIKRSIADEDIKIETVVANGGEDFFGDTVTIYY